MCLLGGGYVEEMVYIGLSVHGPFAIKNYCRTKRNNSFIAHPGNRFILHLLKTKTNEL